MNSSTEHILEITDVDLGYEDNLVITNLNLTIDSGTFIGLVGPNGAGKTTFMSAASGQFLPQKGSIVYRGQDIYADNRNYKYKTGVVHEVPFCYPYLTVSDFLKFIEQIKMDKHKNLCSKTDEILEIVSLENEKNKLCSQLSMGMQKKLAIAAALTGSPEIIFLDEAFVNIDFESLFKIKRHLRDFTNNGGTVLFSTHILEVVEKICDRYIIMVKGKLIKDLTVDEFSRLLESRPEIDFEKFILGLISG